MNLQNGLARCFPVYTYVKTQILKKQRGKIL